MNFFGAFRALREGKAVRRASWPAWRAWVMDFSVADNFIRERQEDGSWGNHWHSRPEDIVLAADDYEVEEG